MFTNELNNRNFLIFLKESKINPNLSLNNLSGEGRLDLVCRVISTTFFLSNSFRNDTNLFLFFQSESILIILYGNRLRNLNPDERSIAGYLKKVFRSISGTNKFNQKFDSGYSWQYFSFKDLPIYFHSGFILDMEGENFDQIEKNEILRQIFVLGDHIGLNDNDKSFLSNFKRISLGEVELHASACITIIHHLIDSKSSN